MSGKQIHVVDVGPRDGFQMEATFIPTDLKVEIIDLLGRAGIEKIEVTSFVSPKVIPQMRDADEVLTRIRRFAGVRHTALVPNLKGAQRAIDAGVEAVRVVICLSESYNRRNVGMGVSESLENCRQIWALTKSHNIGCEAILALAFGCPLEGAVSEERVVGVANELIDMGFGELSIADSIGVANPVQVRRLTRKLLKEAPLTHYSLHFHNTRGLGLANVLAGIEEGVDTFDSSCGGLGGCPVVPGGSGNIPTEDLINMLDEMGYATGVDLTVVMIAARKLQQFLHRPLASHVLSSGTRKELFEGVAGRASATGFTLPDYLKAETNDES
jgi:hydroxymethylglutaryl-CoA lyase